MARYLILNAFRAALAGSSFITPQGVSVAVKKGDMVKPPGEYATDDQAQAARLIAAQCLQAPAGGKGGGSGPAPSKPTPPAPVSHAPAPAAPVEPAAVAGATDPAQAPAPLTQGDGASGEPAALDPAPGPGPTPDPVTPAPARGRGRGRGGDGAKPDKGGRGGNKRSKATAEA